MILCWHCNDEVILLYIQDQSTSLHYAAYNGHTNSVALLIASGANVNMKDDVS